MFSVDAASHEELVRAFNGMAPYLLKAEITTKTHNHERCIDLVEAMIEELGPLGDLQITPKGEVSFIPNGDMDQESFRELDLEARYKPADDEGADGTPEPPPVIDNEPGMAAKLRAIQADREGSRRVGTRKTGGANAKYKDSAVIRVVKSDAKKTGDAKRRFGLFQDGMKVWEYLKINPVNGRRDIRRNTRKGYIKLEG